MLATLFQCAFQACEECKMISRKLHEKPNSIEELSEQRDWIKQIPDQLKAHEVDKLFLYDKLFYKMSGYVGKLLISLINYPLGHKSHHCIYSLYCLLPVLKKYAFSLWFVL